MTTSDYEWLRVTTSGTTSDYEWLRVTTSGTTNDYEWLRVTWLTFQHIVAGVESRLDLIQPELLFGPVSHTFLNINYSVLTEKNYFFEILSQMKYY